MVNFYPRPPRGGRLRFGLCAALPVHISIHALREEGDGFVWGIRLHLRRFLSTPSARRATVPLSQLPHAWGISIHALREEGDPHRHHLSKLAQKFLSTPSARRATCCRPPARGLSPISIHALREEGDLLSSSSTWAFTNFYPRPPRGGRPSRPRSQPTWAAFLSTPSARRATGVHFYKDDYQFISIHALREEGDILQTRKILARDDFYPRPPRGGRLSPFLKF